MDLLDRLKRLGLPRPSAEPEAARLAPGPSRHEAPELAGALLQTNMYGSFVSRETFYPLEHCHGAFALSEALSCQGRVLEVLARDRKMGGFDVSRALFLDTETTGLSGGTGTVAFLVGVAAFEPGGFRVRQLFMRDYDEEQALLYYLAMLLEDRAGFVTYNGKTFDLPLLTTRFVANRLRPPDLEMPHLDLLHSARRLWRHELQEVSLGHVERRVLSVMRKDDIPGMMIPSMYFRYLSSRRPELMEPVLSHNLLDLLSLVSVVAAGARACRGQGRGWGECYGVARTHELMLEREEAIAGYRKALELSTDEGLKRNVRKTLAKALARAGDPSGAEAEWRALADAFEDLDALEALAKRAEHARKDYAEALGYADRALARLNSPMFRTMRAEQDRREAWLLRRGRLARKAASKAGSPRRP